MGCRQGGVVIADELGCTDEGLAAQLSSADEPVKHTLHEDVGGGGAIETRSSGCEICGTLPKRVSRVT